MRVYIEGMELPKGCASCRIKRWSGTYYVVCPLCNEELDIRDPMSADHRLSNCPLVSVPAHGRLIDGDALFRQITFDEHFSVLEAMYVQSLLSGAPTIIPAEEGEKKMTNKEAFEKLFDVTIEQFVEMPRDEITKWENKTNKILWGGFNSASNPAEES